MRKHRIETKKVEPKKIESKKVEPKKIESTKAEPKKIESKKIEKIEQKDPAPINDEAAMTKGNDAVFFEIQYAGKAISYTDIVERARKACGVETGKLDIYVKPEENRVYYVIDGHDGSFEI